MIRAFLYVDLRESAGFPFQNPLLQQVKHDFPAVSTFDLDAASSPLLIDYACRLLDEAAQAVVFFKSEKENALGGTARILEQVIRQRLKCLVLLHGSHPRLRRMLSARTDLRFYAAEEEEELWEKAVAFLGDERREAE